MNDRLRDPPGRPRIADCRWPDRAAHGSKAIPIFRAPGDRWGERQVQIRDMAEEHAGDFQPVLAAVERGGVVPQLMREAVRNLRLVLLRPLEVALSGTPTAISTMVMSSRLSWTSAPPDASHSRIRWSYSLRLATVPCDPR